MIKTHSVQTDNTFTDESGAELYVRLDHETRQAQISYKSADGKKYTLDTVDNLEDFATMITEAVGLIKGIGKVG